MAVALIIISRSVILCDCSVFFVCFLFVNSLEKIEIQCFRLYIRYRCIFFILFYSVFATGLLLVSVRLGNTSNNLALILHLLHQEL